MTKDEAQKEVDAVYAGLAMLKKDQANRRDNLQAEFKAETKKASAEIAKALRLVATAARAEAKAAAAPIRSHVEALRGRKEMLEKRLADLLADQELRVAAARADSQAQTEAHMAAAPKE